MTKHQKKLILINFVLKFINLCGTNNTLKFNLCNRAEIVIDILFQIWNTFETMLSLFENVTLYDIIYVQI